MERFNPEQSHFTVQTKWRPCPRQRVILFDTTDPSGEHYIFRQVLQANWIAAWYYLSPVRPAKTSTWRVHVQEGARLLAAASFTVDLDAPLLPA